MKDIIIWDFSYLSHHEGEKCSQHLSSKQKSGGNYCGQETKGDMAVYPLVSREATELFRKGTRSNARVRNCRLRPWSSRSWRSHRLAVIACQGAVLRFRSWCELCPHPGACVLFSTFCPSLQLSLLFNDYWEPSGKLKICLVGAVCKLYRKVFFLIKISKAVVLLKLQISILYKQILSVKNAL